MDPQCKKDGKVKFNPYSDVFSFGLVLLEIACKDISREQICSLYRSKGDVVEATDQRVKIVGDSERREMESVIILGLWCSASDTQRRPTMQEAMKLLLEPDATLPDLNFITNSASVSSVHDASRASIANRYEEAPQAALLYS
ncbi:Os04g0123700 [Oryza sativa Japonica Group]|uniref:Os04g0123700 protein n=2 Tax=Oryza TaxID=4527 RepID=A0A0P0W6I1_ORYSJ|nr:Os04g0123700 [Oryza sativa Japonica Group]